MPMTSHIKLCGSKAERFLTIKEELSDEHGFDLTNPEVVGRLMSAYRRSVGHKQIQSTGRSRKHA